MADTKISQLPVYPSGATPAATDLLLVIDTSAVPYVSRQANVSALSGGGTNAYTTIQNATGIALTQRRTVQFTGSGVTSVLDDPTNTRTVVTLASTDAYTTIQNSTGTAVTQRRIVQFTGPGVTSVVDDPTNNRTIVTLTGGGGGGGSFTSIVARWTTAASSSKNAQTSPGNINNDGITIDLTASSNPGTLTAWTITLNGTALTNTYTASGTFPAYRISIPVADLTGNAIETAATVTVALANSMFNLTANNLTNVQPVPFTTTLSGSYSVASAPFYVSSGLINYSYSNSNAITVFGGTITPTGGLAQNATSPSGSFSNQPINGAAIGGSATGTGLNGAGSSTVNLTGSIPALPTFVPAWLSQTANNTPPAFTTADAPASGTLVTNTRYQTGRAAQGATITYPTATASTQYNWICTQRPLANLMLVTTFGNTPLVPDVTAPTQTLGGQTFQVYGWTGLGVGTASVLLIG